jgi:pimeloyl-ACP methyl ester carboxylesterase
MAKKLSRAKKIFLAGRSRGGTQMYIYASKYWQEDLKGLIGLDGAASGPTRAAAP